MTLPARHACETASVAAQSTSRLGVEGLVRGAFVINFHGIGNAGRPFDTGEAPFWIDTDQFTDVLAFAADEHRTGAVAFTFDDGNLSDYAIAAPALERRGLSATFFIVAGRIGQPGFLRKDHIRDLRRAGFCIGSHGFDHIDWSRLDDAQLEHELRDSRSVIEDVLGEPVVAAAIPFGRYDGRVLGALRRTGYHVALSSDGGPRLTAQWPRPRRSIRRDMSKADLAGRLRTARTPLQRAVQELRLQAKIAALGLGLTQ